MLEARLHLAKEGIRNKTRPAELLSAQLAIEQRQFRIDGRRFRAHAFARSLNLERYAKRSRYVKDLFFQPARSQIPGNRTLDLSFVNRARNLFRCCRLNAAKV